MRGQSNRQSRPSYQLALRYGREEAALGLSIRSGERSSTGVPSSSLPIESRATEGGKVPNHRFVLNAFTYPLSVVRQGAMDDGPPRDPEAVFLVVTEECHNRIGPCSANPAIKLGHHAVTLEEERTCMDGEPHCEPGKGTNLWPSADTVRTPSKVNVRLRRPPEAEPGVLPAFARSDHTASLRHHHVQTVTQARSTQTQANGGAAMWLKVRGSSQQKLLTLSRGDLNGG